MSSRKLCRIAVLAFILSLGVQHAHAAGAASRTNSSIIQGELSLRTLIQAMRDTWSIFPVTKDDPPPNNPGNDPNGPTNGNHEGTVGCPLGPPGGVPPGPPNGGGPAPSPAH
jgi:hypothetical protein